MAQSGYTPIQLYYSTTAAAVPTNTNLASGELALNIQDEKLYFKNAAGTVKLLASNATSAPVLSFSAGTTGFTPSTATTGAVTLAGTLATTNGGTGLTSFTSTGIVYASSSSVLATSSALTFNGTDLTYQAAATYPIKLINNDGAGRQAISANYIYGGTGATNTLTLSSTYGNANQNIIKVGVGGAAATSFEINSTEGMRLTSTGLGIGTSSPITKLQVSGTNATLTLSDTNASGGSYSNILYRNTDGTSTAYNIASVLGLTTSNGGNGALAFYTAASNSNTEKMRLDTAGNLGLGVTPSAWFSTGARAFELGYKGTALWTYAQSGLYISTNAYYDTNWKYGGTGLASTYNQENGAHRFFTAASGTAGNAISFTQAMTLDASGNLGVGTTSPSVRIQAEGSSSTSLTTLYLVNSSSAAVTTKQSNLSFRLTDTANTRKNGFQLTAYSDSAGGNIENGGLIFSGRRADNDLEFARIDTSGNLLIGSTAARGTTVGTAHLDLFNGTAPAGTLTNGVSLYSSSGDLKFMDSAGNAYSVGYRNVPQSGSSKTASYTLATTDVGEYILLGASGAIVIPDATFAAGDVITIFNNTASTATITCSITTAYIAGTFTDKATMTLAAAGVATVLFITSTLCVVSGNVT